MSETAEVVVIGAGAVGASTAFHLARLGVTDVVLLERDTIASGSTGRAVGGIRCQFGDETNIRVCQRSLAAFQHFTEMLPQNGAIGHKLRPTNDYGSPVGLPGLHDQTPVRRQCITA